MDVPACQGCVALMKLVEQLQVRLAQVEAELAAAKKNSSNSSKSPSSDIVKPPKPKSPKKRKCGGQPGHPRHQRSLFADDQVDYTDLHCVECPDCHGPVVPSKLPPKVIQQVELPLPSELIRVVGFRAHACWCRKCQQVHYASVDATIRRAGLVGPRLTGLVADRKSTRLNSSHEWISR